MPELPEVETVVRTLRPHIQGKSVLSVQSFGASCLAPASRSLDILYGALVSGVVRRGKYIVIRLEKGAEKFFLVVHLRMTGRPVFRLLLRPLHRLLFRPLHRPMICRLSCQPGRTAFWTSTQGPFSCLGIVRIALPAVPWSSMMCASSGVSLPVRSKTFKAGLPGKSLALSRLKWGKTPLCRP